MRIAIIGAGNVGGGLGTALAATGRERARRLTKPLLMPALAVGKDRPTQRALALSGAGDVALLGESDLAFTAGLSSFLGAQLAWVAALRQRGRGGRRESRELDWVHMARPRGAPCCNTIRVFDL